MSFDILTTNPQRPEYARVREGRGQRQLGAPRVLLAAALLGLTAAAGAQTTHRPVARVDLPSSPMGVVEADGWIVASLGLNGVAFVPATPWAETPEVLHRADWPTLSVHDLPGPGMLLAGRDGLVRYVKCDPPGSEPVLLTEFALEGVPNEVLLHGDTLVLAAGGAGLSLWDWADRSTAPTLRGRYPFVEFARRMAMESDGSDRLYVADSLGGRVAILDITDPMRPRLEQSYPVSSFCDSVEVGPKHLVFTDRNAATFVARRPPVSLPGHLWVLHQELPLINPMRERSDVKRAVLLAGHDAFLVCEAESGVRHLQIEDGSDRFHEVARYAPLGSAVDATLTASGHIVVADHPAGLSMFHMAEQ